MDSLPAASQPQPSVVAAEVRLEGIRKTFGDVVSVAGVDLEIREGEFFSLLGPSGCGKTTCLRMIAGFEEPTAGRIVLHGRDVAGLPAYDRDVNTVFQDYALFPHMSVHDNVEYGLLVKGVGRGERSRRVAEALRMMQLERFGRRKPDEVSAPVVVQDFVYVGDFTCFVVHLDACGELVVLQQNLSMSSMDALQARGRRVRMFWNRQHSRVIATAGSDQKKEEIG